MKKQQIEIERSLRSTSANIIWGIISTNRLMKNVPTKSSANCLMIMTWSLFIPNIVN